MGRWLDQHEIDRLSQRTRLSLSLRPIDDPGAARDFSSARLMLSVNQPVAVRRLGEDLVAGYRLVADLQNRPMLMLKIELPRTVYSQGKVTVLYLMLSILAVGIVFNGTMYLLLDSTILSRLARLSSGVDAYTSMGMMN
jgi:sensor domain CHASE-containing protein